MLDAMQACAFNTAILFLLDSALFAGVNGNFKSGKALTQTLNDGREIPVLGLGTSVRDGDPEQIKNAVELAIDAGYRHIDTAARYNTEKQVGEGVRNKIKDDTINREDIFITTKLWNNNHRKEQVIPALQKSLDKLGMDYVDLYLIHTPISTWEDGNYTNTGYVETWAGMVEAQKLDLAKSIGISNFNESQIMILLNSSNIKPAVNQIEVNPHLTQRLLVTFCQNHGIQVVAYSPLGSMPESRFKTNNRPPKRSPLRDEPILTEIGNNYNKSTFQVALRYLLSPEDVEKIEAFNINYRIVNPKEWQGSPFYPF